MKSVITITVVGQGVTVRLDHDEETINAAKGVGQIRQMPPNFLLAMKLEQTLATLHNLSAVRNKPYKWAWMAKLADKYASFRINFKSIFTYSFKGFILGLLAMNCAEYGAISSSIFWRVFCFLGYVGYCCWAGYLMNKEGRKTII